MPTDGLAAQRLERFYASVGRGSHGKDIVGETLADQSVQHAAYLVSGVQGGNVVASGELLIYR